MRRLMQAALLAAVTLAAGSLVTACAQSARGAVTASSPGTGAPATSTAQPSATPTTPSPTEASSSASPTAAPSTATTAPSPTPSSSSPPASGSGFNLIWLWGALGAVALLGIILLATRSRAPARPPAAGTSWHSRAVDAYAKGAALDGAVRAAERQGVFTDPASVRWADLQRRADDLTEALYAMRELAPPGDRLVQAEDAILAIQGVRAAMDAQRSPGDASPQHLGVLDARLSALEASLNALRIPETPPA